MSQMQNQQVDRKDLKIQALLEKLGSQASNYENQIADLRVELTYLEQKVNELSAINTELSQPPVMPMHASEIVQGEVVPNGLPQAPPEQ